MTDPTNPSTGAEGTAHPDSATIKAVVSNPSSWSRLRKPAIWLALALLAGGGVSSIALARHGGWHDDRDGGRHGYFEGHDDGHYDRSGRYGGYDRQHLRGGYRDDGPGGWFRGRQTEGPQFGGFGVRFMDRMLSEVNATDEQRTKITGIIRAARNDIEALRDRLPDARKTMIDLLAKPTIDRPAVEAARVESQKVRDELSKRVTQAMADVTEMLSPEQRAGLAQIATRRWGGRNR